VLIRGVEVADGSGFSTADVRVRDGLIEAIAVGLAPETGASGEVVISGNGGALLPGLHDHHIHLFSLAAALRSVRCGPPQVEGRDELARVLGAAGGSSRSSAVWIRGVGYHESVAGDLDAEALEGLIPERPTRIQHRSGALWIVNRAGLEKLGLDRRVPDDAPPGIERDRNGRATGRLYRADDWLRRRLGALGIGASAPPHLGDAGATLARCGVTGVTDATPGNDETALDAISKAIAGGALCQNVRMMGRPSLPTPTEPGVRLGEVKLVLNEAEPLDLEAVTIAIRDSHRRERSTAVHCVTRAELVVALAAFEAAGTRVGDRIEHASVTPPELAIRLAELGIGVVTQPNFIRERGDAYRRDVEARDQPWLYRCGGLISAGVAVGGGTDAPFGDPNPWRAMQAAVDRRTAGGIVLAEDEAVSPERALCLFTTSPEAPGGPPRRIAIGAAADLCLLDRPWSKARDALDEAHVAATFWNGRISWQRESD
jgi:predicted amidohydrolase YtcJ